MDIRENISFLKIQNKMKQIDMLKQRVEKMYQGQIEHICIFCAGVYGRRLYKNLRERNIRVSCFVDNNKEKHGDLIQLEEWRLVAEIGLKCIGLDQLPFNKSEVLMVVANKAPDEIILDLQNKGFPHVISSRQMDTLLEGIPKIGIDDCREELEGLDYSNSSVKLLIQLFNREIRNLCSLYERGNIAPKEQKSLEDDLPLVSVIMPVYNAERYIKTAIYSILNQTYSNLELILIDDCPTDRTMEIAKSIRDPRIRIIHNGKNRGIAYSKNQGLIHSRGKYIAFMDDDDISMPMRLEYQVTFLEEHSDIGVLGGRHEIVDGKGQLIMPAGETLYNPQYIKAMYLFRNVYVNSTITLRRELVEQYNLRFMNNCFGMEDFRFGLECSKLCKMTAVDKVILQRRQNDKNESTRILKRDLTEKRKKLYADFQKYSLKRSGFELTSHDLKILTKVMAESDGVCDTLEELQAFYNILRKLVKQSDEKTFDNALEIKELCKMLFREKWNQFNVSGLWEEQRE